MSQHDTSPASQKEMPTDASLELEEAEIPETPKSVSRLSSKQRRQRMMMFAGVIALFVIAAGVMVASLLSKGSLDLRQRAAATPCTIMNATTACGANGKCVNLNQYGVGVCETEARVSISSTNDNCTGEDQIWTSNKPCCTGLIVTTKTNGGPHVCVSDSIPCARVGEERNANGKGYCCAGSATVDTTSICKDLSTLPCAQVGEEWRANGKGDCCAGSAIVDTTSICKDLSTLPCARVGEERYANGKGYCCKGLLSDKNYICKDANITCASIGQKRVSDGKGECCPGSTRVDDSWVCKDNSTVPCAKVGEERNKNGKGSCCPGLASVSNVCRPLNEIPCAPEGYLSNYLGYGVCCSGLTDQNIVGSRICKKIVAPAPMPVVSTDPACTILVNDKEPNFKSGVTVTLGSKVKLSARTASTGSTGTQLFISPLGRTPQWLPAPNRASGTSPQSVTWTPAAVGQYYVVCNDIVKGGAAVGGAQCSGNPWCTTGNCAPWKDCGSKDVVVVTVKASGDATILR